MRTGQLGLALCFIALGACSASPGFRTDGGDARRGDGAACSAGQTSCVGNVARVCDGLGGYTSMTTCVAPQVCAQGIGCSTCVPNAHTCAMDGTPGVCSADGTTVTPGSPCPSGSYCSQGSCVDLCGQAVASHSYIGCDYWPVALVNSALGSIPSDPTNPASTAVGVDGFPFAVAVANPQEVPATVTITGGAIGAPMTATVMPNALQVINLPWVQSTSQVTLAGTIPTGPGTSVFAAGAAYHLTSNVPVTVYQFNALSYRDVRRSSCDPALAADQPCFSYTNDSSLLLPTSVLTGNYTAVSWPSETFTDAFTTQTSSTGGYVAIVGTAPDTMVTVHLTGSVRPGTGVARAASGGTITRTLQPGDVLELVSGDVTAANCTRDPTSINPSQGLYVCNPDPAFDLTGSIVTASAPVAVFGGHDCTFIPYNRYACDHLEQQLFPNETLGTHYVVAHTQPQLSGHEPNVVRITSNHDGNAITFAPASVHAPVTLNRGQYTDFEQHDDVEITGTGAMIMTQFTVGESYFGNGVALPPTTVGDPSMCLEVPVEQWRTSYEFLAPDTYPVSFVNVVAQHGATILLDGVALTTNPTPLNGFDVYRVDISSNTGAHQIQSSDATAFSIKVYGFGSYTSYMYPGGLDLTLISPPG